MGIETSVYIALEIARMGCWERGDGLGAGELRGSYFSGTL